MASERPIRFIRRQAVEDRTGMGKSLIYKLMARGDFPKPVQLSPGSVAWVEADIDAWQRQRIAASARRSAA